MDRPGGRARVLNLHHPAAPCVSGQDLRHVVGGVWGWKKLLLVGKPVKKKTALKTLKFFEIFACGKKIVENLLHALNEQKINFLHSEDL